LPKKHSAGFFLAKFPPLLLQNLLISEPGEATILTIRSQQRLHALIVFHLCKEIGQIAATVLHHDPSPRADRPHMRRESVFIDDQDADFVIGGPPLARNLFACG